MRIRASQERGRRAAGESSVDLTRLDPVHNCAEHDRGSLLGDSCSGAGNPLSTGEGRSAADELCRWAERRSFSGPGRRRGQSGHFNGPWTSRYAGQRSMCVHGVGAAGDPRTLAQFTLRSSRLTVAS
jgi:hypothetical protein